MVGDCDENEGFFTWAEVQGISFLQLVPTQDIVSLLYYPNPDEPVPKRCLPRIFLHTLPERYKKQVHSGLDPIGQIMTLDGCIINQVTLNESMDLNLLRIEHLGSHIRALPKIVSWVHAEWGPLMPDTPYSKLVSIFEERVIPHKIPETFVALRSDEIVGTASIVKQDMSTRIDLSPWLAAVYVPPEHRGLGIGSDLVRAAIDETRVIGLERFYLITPDRVAFYARLGWVELENAEYRGENVTIMMYENQEPS